ncbi:PrsW family intramembrane metalloprotease [Nocardioides sp. HDW12B]|uniref:PrsW family intramembrane metalloprotease n=1 Tax=Nocardioides sp. HDW12B TaxID=2714939 RepID=UPI00140BBE37|nr:PrsW family intramembrane metalloprotease [Nocardioides sp. HDW12B]QIK65740.1 PrsW family intramembrane metalloprotease [Nocardioides sp. HDW12B]
MTWGVGEQRPPQLWAPAAHPPAHGQGHGWSQGWAPPPLPPVPPSLSSRRNARSIVFAVLVAVGLLIGAGVIGFVFVASGQPEAIAVGFVLALLPVGPLVGCYLWLDRYEPEPGRLLLMAFGWGALVATATALVLQVVDDSLSGRGMVWSGVVVAPISEEAAKGAFVLLLLWLRRHVIHGVLDGLVYAGLVGIGFAFTENILYFAGAYAGEMGLGPGGFGAATTIFVVRGVFSPFAHPLFTSAIGIGAGIMVGTRRRWLRWLAPLVGYLVAVGLHAAWNGSAFLADGRFFPLTYFFAMVPGFFVLVGLAIWFRVREGRMLTRSLTDLAHRGYLGLDEVLWLVRPPARRTARRNARRRGGPGAEKLLKDYQRQAIELAVLHDHVMRGHRGRRGRDAEDTHRRGAHMAHRLGVLRAHVTAPPQPAWSAWSAWPHPHSSGWPQGWS